MVRAQAEFLSQLQQGLDVKRDVRFRQINKPPVIHRSYKRQAIAGVEILGINRYAKRSVRGSRRGGKGKRGGWCS